MTHVLFWAALMDQEEEAQVVIPDLEDEDVLGSCFDATLNNGFSSPNGLPTDPRSADILDAQHLPPPFPTPSSSSIPISTSKRTPGKLLHFRTASLTADESASISAKSSLRFGSSFSNAFQGMDYFQSPGRSTDALHNFSFPVKKPSFASLRAAIKGQPSTPTHKEPSSDAGPSPLSRSADISAVSSSLMQSTSTPWSVKWHKKGASQDGSLSGPLNLSPTRPMRPQHAHKISQMSDMLADGMPVSPLGNVAYPTSHDMLSSPVEDVDALHMLSPFSTTPSAEPMTYAMRQIFARFQALADDALHAVLVTQQDCDVLSILFPTQAHRTGWDDVLSTMASLARHNRPLVIESLLTWRSDVLDHPLSLRPTHRRPSDALSISSINSVAGDVLHRRRALASTYLTSQALLVTVPPGTNDRMGDEEEDPAMNEFVTTVFQFLHLCSMDRESERGSQTRLHTSLQQQCFDVVARLIGELSRHCLPMLGAQFVSILQQSSTVVVSRDNELLTEAAVLGMRYLRIITYPMDVFETGAEFLQVLARFFVHSHGYRIKRAFARVLHTIIEPVARTASAELFHPTWMDAMATLMPKTQGMAMRARYFGTAYPLWTVALCASPPDVLVDRWFPCVEAGWSRMRERKDTETRAMVYACAAQLFWAYLFRCHEGTNPTQRRLDAFFGLCLPPVRTAVSPTDVCVDSCVDMLSAALYRQIEYTYPLILDMLRHTSLDKKSAPAVFQPDLLQPVRMCIAIRSVARTRHYYVCGEMPSLPGAALPSMEELAIEPEGSMAVPNAHVEQVQMQLDAVMTQVALHCDYLLKDLTVLDGQVPLAPGTNAPHLPTTPGSEPFEVRTHAQGAFTVAYAAEHQPYLDLLRTCIETWPRCMSHSVSKATCHSLLFRGLFCVEPRVQQASAAALSRIARGGEGAHSILRALLQWLFRKDGVVWELQSHADVLVAQFAQVADVMVSLLELCGTETPPPDELETGAWLLLCVPSSVLRHRTTRLLLHHTSLSEFYTKFFMRPCTDFIDQSTSSQLSASQRARIAKWRDAGSAYPLNRLASSSENGTLWSAALPRVLQHLEQRAPHLTEQLYVLLLGAVQRLEPSMASIARLRKGTAQVPLTLTFLRQIWRMYVLALCTVCRAHTQHIALLMPYLVCDDYDLQSTAAEALSHCHALAYPTLISALSHLFDNMHWPVRLCIGHILAQTTAALTSASSLAPWLLTWIHQTMHILQFDLAPDVQVYRLRRYLCMVLAGFYSSLEAEHAAHVFPVELRMRLLIVLHDWRSLQDASRLAAQLSAALERTASKPKDKIIVSLRHELHLLALCAEDAMAALCAGGFGSTTMDTSPVLTWLCEMLAAPLSHTRDTAQRGLRALLMHNPSNAVVLDTVVAYCYHDLSQSHASRTAFAVLCDTYPHLEMPAAHIVCLSLCLLAHPDVHLRTRALNMLESFTDRQSTPVSLISMSPSVLSFHPAVYLDAQSSISQLLSHATVINALAEWTRRIDDIPPSFHEPVLSLIPPWLRAASLGNESDALVHLVTLSHLFGRAHPLAVRNLWQAVGWSTADTHALLHFLHTRTLHYRSFEFLEVARLIVANLPPAARQVAQHALLESMVPEAAIPYSPSGISALSIDAYFPPPGTELMPLAPTLISLLFFGECVDASLLRHERLPIVLHLLCMYLDGTSSALHSSILRAAEQILSVLPTRIELQTNLFLALRSAHAMSRIDLVTYGAMHVPQKLEVLVNVLCDAAERHVIPIRDVWCDVAQFWAVNAPVRRMACRSLQVMRALRPTYAISAVPSLLARLAETLPSSEAMPYTLELLSTLEAIIPTAVPEVLAPIFWAVAACVQTTWIPVFVATVSLLHTWMDHIDMSLSTCNTLWTSRPSSWNVSAAGIQCALVRGLRLPRCDVMVLHLLERMAHIEHHELLESTMQDRVLTLFTAALPWFLQACENEKSAHHALVLRLGDALTNLANNAQRSDVARITASIARGRFRRADDLARQAALSIALGCTQPRAVHLVTLLVLMLYHESEDLCRLVLLALPPCLQALQAQDISSLVPDVPLDPLVRLLHSPLASLALDVLHSPIFVDESSTPTLQVCGWTGLSAESDARMSCSNMQAVSKTWSVPDSERGVLAFVPDGDGDADDERDELDTLASQLDDLASFFVQDSTEPPSPQPSQVAKILARSARHSYIPQPSLETTTNSLDASTASYDTMSLAPQPLSFSTYSPDPFLSESTKISAPIDEASIKNVSLL